MSEKTPGRGAANSNIVSEQIAHRRAVAELLERNRELFVSRKIFRKGGMEARVLVDGRYYDVNEGQLGRLREGWKPADLSLDGVEPDE